MERILNFANPMIALLITLLVATVAFVFVWYLFLAPRVGGEPEGDRKQRILASPHQREGLFQNPVDTDMRMPGHVMTKVLWEMMKGERSREPRQAIPVEPFHPGPFTEAADQGFAFTWFGHSSLLIALDGVTFLCDPVFGERPSPFPFMGPKRFRFTEHMTVEKLPHVDVVLLSHDHFDHLCHETILRLRDKRFICPLGVGAHLERWGVPHANIEEFDRWGGAIVNGVRLTLVPTRHFSGRKLSNRFTTLWGGWVLEGREKRLLFGADSSYFSGFAELGERFGGFDLVFLECGAYSPYWPHVHMFPEETAQAAVDLKARVLVPIHWAKYSLAMHPWKEPIERLTAKAEALSQPIYTPRIGEVSTSADPALSARWWSDLS